MKSFSNIRDEFFDNNGKISDQSMKDLIWHIENDPLPSRVISFVTDERLMKLVPLIAKHLDHEDDFIRELTVGCVVDGLECAEYAEKALDMAEKDPDSGPRVLATFSLGAVINKVDPVLRKKIAIYLYDVITSCKYDKSYKRCAFDSILKAMDVPIPQQLTISYDENHDLVKAFKVKYGI